MMTVEQIIALLREPPDDVVELLYEAGTAELDENEGFSSEGVRCLLSALARVIEAQRTAG